MKRAFFAIVAASLGFAGMAPAKAADLPNRIVKPAPVLVAPFTWSGFYVGAYVGGAFGHDKLKSPNVNQNVTLDPTGVTAGGYVGYNYQINAVVLGLEGEFGYNGIDDDKDFGLQSHNAKVESSYIGRIRGRVGYAFGTFLLYGAGGVSFTDQKVTQVFLPTGLSDSVSKGLVGWNLGLGGEYAFTPNLIARIEYIFDDFGK